MNRDNPRYTAGDRSLRLADKVALITGAAGNLGGEITRHYLREGARVVMTGRTKERLHAARDRILEETGASEDRVLTVILDGADAASVRAGINQVRDRFGHIDILVNNAGSAGPKQPIDSVPTTPDQLATLQTCGSSDSETVADAMRNILGVSWNLVRAAEPLLSSGSSVINVSTIFSHTQYYGRTAYVVPKAALNVLSRELAVELGPRGIRVNLLYPGPIKSERIESVFSAMDKLQGLSPGGTADTFKSIMTLERAVDGQPKAKTFPTPDDIAQTCVFLGSDESAAFNGHDFEVTHGMSVTKESRTTLQSPVDTDAVDGHGKSVLVAGGEAWQDALEIASILTSTGADVLLGLPGEEDVAAANSKSGSDKLTVVRMRRTDTDAIEQALDDFTNNHAPISGAIILSAKPPGHFHAPLSSITDSDLDAFMDEELGGAIAMARATSRYWMRQGAEVPEPRFVFMSNPSDSTGDTYAKVLSAGIAQLITIWRDETEVDVRLGRRGQSVFGNQIIRYSNTEPGNVSFACGHAADIAVAGRCIAESSLYLPSQI